MCTSHGYKALPYILAFISLIEMVLGIIRIGIFFTPKPSSDGKNASIYSQSQSTESSLRLSQQSTAAFALDWIGSVVPTLMGIYVAVFLLLTFCSVCVTCQAISNACNFRRTDRNGCSRCCSLMGFLCMNKANHRFVSLTCNCPCYTARPQLRFQVRIGLMSFFIFVRVIAIILYASDKTTGVYGGYMASLCTGSIALSSIVIVLDFYQYRVWWYYRPDRAYERCRCCCCKQHFHPSHRRFLPIPLLGVNRRIDAMGNQPCQYTATGHCPNLSLEHIVIFHALDFIPQRRYERGNDLTYIAFHRTTPEAAINIARTGFRIGRTPPQMLGFGIYFARSFQSTIGKARFDGALICAQIELRRVLPVTQTELHQVSNSDAWWQDFDTVYYAHVHENRDEFCVKDPSQILKWVIVMDDDRLRRYGLHTEFTDTLFGCI